MQGINISRFIHSFTAGMLGLHGERDEHTTMHVYLGSTFRGVFMMEGISEGCPLPSPAPQAAWGVGAAPFPSHCFTSGMALPHACDTHTFSAQLILYGRYMCLGAMPAKTFADPSPF